MSRELITAEPKEPLFDVARKMNKHRIHRILITDGSRLAGVITAFDFVHAFADGRITMAHNVTP
jgi:CBS domain-containing protein